ncbi:Nn.00g080570.m01.CDS01 [Neocucurbitaria sp. VM-36]
MPVHWSVANTRSPELLLARVHPISTVELSKKDEDYLAWIAQVLIDYIQDNSVWGIELNSLSDTVRRIVGLVMFRHGNLDLLNIERSGRTFIQRMQQQLHGEQPQQNIIINQDPQQVFVQRPQPDIVVRQQAAQNIVVQQLAPRIIVQQQDNSVTNPPGPELRRSFEEEQKEKEESFKRRYDEENHGKARLREATEIATQVSEDDSGSNTDDDDEDKKIDPYEAMGLRDRYQTSMDVTRSTYNTLALIFHSDKRMNKTEQQIKHAAKRMYEINKAKDILLDVERRQAFDEEGAVYEYEFEEWKSNNGSGGKGKGKYIGP